MIIHKMRLNTEAFVKIADASKIYEIRLNDPKRQSISIGDVIVFSERGNAINKINAKVQGLVKADTFEELFYKISPKLAGWSDSDSPKKCAEDMEKYYSLEDQEKYKVIAIKVKILKKTI